MKIKLKDIIVGERYRKEFKNIDVLAQSIKEKGQLVPIIIDEKNNLIAGERRYKAHQMLQLPEIDAIYMKDLNEYQKRDIEIEENIQREAFTWEEEVEAKAQLHKLKQQMYGAAVSGHRVEGAWNRC